MAENFPDSVIIVGAGVFGLSTALAIARRYPSTKVTVIDRYTPPVPDGTSVDTSKILRPDYVDKVYERLADKAQALIRNDPELHPHYFERGFTFCTDGKEGGMNTLWEQMFDNIKETQPAAMWNELKDPTSVYRHLHGQNGDPTPNSDLPGPRMWMKGYTSKRCATVDAEGMVKVYYDRCCQKHNIEFVIGTPVDRLLYGPCRSVDGVILEDGRELRTQKTILATGAWSSRLVNLDQQMHANAVGIAYIKLSPDEYERYKDIACHTNLVTGVNIFTPLGGYLKILRRTTGLRNTTTLKDPEDTTKTYQASYPLTKADDPTQTLSADMEQSIREEMREILPQFANHPFASTKFCWLEQTTNGEFLICPHPKFNNLHLATGGSLHGWKFLPLLGEFVVDSISGKLEDVLVKKWSWESKADAKQNKFGFMTPGKPREFQESIGHL